MKSRRKLFPNSTSEMENHIRCALCGNYTIDNHYVLKINIGVKNHFVCLICGNIHYSNYIIFGRKKFYVFDQYMKNSIVMGYIILHADRAAIKIQRKFRKYKARKEKILSLLLVKERLGDGEKSVLPFLPSEMWEHIIRFT